MLGATLRWIAGLCSVRRPVPAGGIGEPVRGLASAGVVVTGAPRGERRLAGVIAAGAGALAARVGESWAGVAEPAADTGTVPAAVRESPCGERRSVVPACAE